MLHDSAPITDIDFAVTSFSTPGIVFECQVVSSRISSGSPDKLPSVHAVRIVQLCTTDNKGANELTSQGGNSCVRRSYRQSHQTDCP